MGRSDTPTDMGSSAIALDASKHPQQSFHFLQIFEAAIQPHVISGLLVGHSSSARLARGGSAVTQTSFHFQVWSVSARHNSMT
jgi:hypothetical protein